ncbi:MAG: glycosyltransferase family 10 [Litorimonas sp.]
MRIKFVSKTPRERLEPLWRAILPDEGIGGAEFTFDPDARDYDFLAVYEDFPPRPGERRILHTEPLSCPRSHTLLITTEPSSIRLDGLRYLAQFGHVCTSRSFTPVERRFLDKAGTVLVDVTPPLRWFYGRDMEGDAHWPLHRIEASPDKSDDLSTVTSNKAMSHTVHAARLAFVKAVKAELCDGLALYGRGFDPIDDKAEAMARYRYHLAIENHVQPGHHTEKLTDCFLAECLPFYFGDPDYTRVYPEDAAIPIDIFDLPGSLRTIRQAIDTNQFSERLGALREAKAIALNRSNPLRFAARIATNAVVSGSKGDAVIYGRHAFRRAHPLSATLDALHAALQRRSSLASPLQRDAKG